MLLLSSRRLRSLFPLQQFLFLFLLSILSPIPIPFHIHIIITPLCIPSAPAYMALRVRDVKPALRISVMNYDGGNTAADMNLAGGEGRYCIKVLVKKDD